MKTGIYDIEISSGTPTKITFVSRDPTGVPTDWTGWSAHTQVRASANGIVLVDSSTTNGKIKPLTSDGVVEVEFTFIRKSKTEHAVYDVLMTSPAGEKFVFLRGNANIVFNVTKD